MISSGMTIESIMNEIKLTIVVCNNCHSKLHREKEFNNKISNYDGDMHTYVEFNFSD